MQVCLQKVIVLRYSLLLDGKAKNLARLLAKPYLLWFLEQQKKYVFFVCRYEKTTHPSPTQGQGIQALDRPQVQTRLDTA